MKGLQKVSERRSIELLSEIARLTSASLEKLEEIRYGLADNETGISNLLKQMKITNSRLDDLADKRIPNLERD